MKDKKMIHLSLERKKLNQSGITHYLIPILIVMTVAIGGTYLLVSSYAASTPGSGNDSSSTPGSGSGSSSTPGGPLNPTTPGAKPRSAPAAPVVAQGDPGGGNTGSRVAGNGGPAANDQSRSGTVRITQPKSSKASFKTKSKPSGDIIVVTYVNDPEIDKKGDKDHRIGGFKVKVERQGGKNFCDNTKKNFGTTNKTKMHTPKGEKPVLVHGTVHFLNCDAGKYKVTVTKVRSGYKMISPTVREFTLNDNETEVPFFVAEKKAKANSTNTPAPSSGANGTGTGVGGATTP